MNYRVFNDGKQIDVQSCRIYPKPYNSMKTMEYVMFDITDRKDLIIESKEAIKSAVIRPVKANIPFEIRGGKVVLTLHRPVKLSLEINGSSENNLMIFAQEKEKPLPEKTQNLIRIKKDEQHEGTLTIDKDNTTVYIEKDAVLHGNIIAEDCENITICGYGKICMERYTYEMRRDFARSVDIRGCKNVSIRDIIVDDSNDWSMRITGCDNVEVTNVKIFGCRGNSDGIDVCGSRNVTVSDIFTRVWDDSFVVKSLGTGNTENVVFKDSVLWNDFARPMEVGVELRADRVRNIRFENIDIIHSATGYPLMGIHHGDHAEVSDIVFDNIRIEDTPGAQLFDIRIADSVWSRDNRMGNIHDVTFSNIDYIGTDDNDIMLSNSRIEGFSPKHDIKNINFHNIRMKGKNVLTAKELGLDIYQYVEGVSITADNRLPKAELLSCDIKTGKTFTYHASGMYRGSVVVRLHNDNTSAAEGEAAFAVAPKNTAAEKKFTYRLAPHDSAEYEFELNIQPGKYVFYLKNAKNEIENKFLFAELPMLMQKEIDIKQCPKYKFTNYYQMDCAEVRLALQGDMLMLVNEHKNAMDFILYTAMPVEIADGEVLFSVEETDFGEVCALINRGGTAVPAPQLRCPAEITYVFRNEPKVKEIIKTPFRLESGEKIQLPLSKLGIDQHAGGFLMELEAKPEETAGLRYPYTLFHSTMPEKTAHMYGYVKILEKGAQ